MRLLTAFLVVLLVAACKSPTEPNPEWDYEVVEVQESYTVLDQLDSNNIFVINTYIRNALKEETILVGSMDFLNGDKQKSVTLYSEDRDEDVEVFILYKAGRWEDINDYLSRD